MWILTNPHHFLTMYTWDVLSANANRTKTIIELYKKMFESRISAGATEKLSGWEKPHAQTVAWSYDMEGHARKCVERYCELANKKVEQLYKVSSPFWMIINSSRRNSNQLENRQKLAHKIVLKCLYLARIGRPDILLSFNKLARSVTKWTLTCDRRFVKADFVHSSHKRFPTILSCGKHGTALQTGFQDSDFAGDLEDSNSEGVLCIFGSGTLVPVSRMCKKQTAVSHSSTEFEIISLNAGLRMDGLPALDLSTFNQQ